MSLADKKRSICDRLREIWTLSHSQRRTAIKRLFLQYHPDKNPDNVQEYENLFQFLLDQINHLENNEDFDATDTTESSAASGKGNKFSGRQNSRPPPTWSRDFENWSYTARRHKQSRNKCSRSNHQQEFFSNFTRKQRDTSSSFSSFFREEKRNSHERNPTEGWRWIRQAKADFRDLQSCLCHANHEGGYSLVCFLAHQVAEKALKGALLALCDNFDSREMESHTLLNHSNILSNLRPYEAQNIPELCVPLTPYYQKTRYPDQWPGFIDIPSEHYQLEEAEQAMKIAENILHIIISIMPQIHEE